MKLYDFPLSGHAHRARLFASLIDAEVEIVHVDLPGGAHKTADFLAKNVFGQVPVLEDGDTIVSDSNAILVYLAKKFGKTDWLPEDAPGAARVQRWLSVAAGELAYGPAAARLITVFGASFDVDEVAARAERILTVINKELTSNAFITGTGPSIADVSLYSYIAAAPEGNIDLTPYSNVTDWLRRVEALPGFIPFQETAAGLRQSTQSGH